MAFGRIAPATTAPRYKPLGACLISHRAMLGLSKLLELQFVMLLTCHTSLRFPSREPTLLGLLGLPSPYYPHTTQGIRQHDRRAPPARVSRLLCHRDVQRALPGNTGGLAVTKGACTRSLFLSRPCSVYVCVCFPGCIMGAMPIEHITRPCPSPDKVPAHALKPST